MKQATETKAHYITLANNFWMATIEGVTSTETHLYFRLVYICNNLSWKNPFNYKDASLYGELGMSNKTFKKARQCLVDRKLINYSPGHKGVNSTYELLFIDRKNYHQSTVLVGEIPTNDPSNDASATQLQGELVGGCAGETPNYNNTDTDTVLNTEKKEEGALPVFFDKYMETYQTYYKKRNSGATYQFQKFDSLAFLKLVEFIKEDCKQHIKEGEVISVTEAREIARFNVLLFAAYWDCTEVQDLKYPLTKNFSPNNINKQINRILPAFQQKLNEINRVLEFYDVKTRVGEYFDMPAYKYCPEFKEVLRSRNSWNPSQDKKFTN